MIELLPELLKVLSELNKVTPEKNPNLEQVTEALAEVIAAEKTESGEEDQG